jgi:nucleoside 2-deoxyribosyltransferase
VGCGRGRIWGREGISPEYAIFSSDLCMALLGGPDHDSGTSAEPGYLYALGKP